MRCSAARYTVCSKYKKPLFIYRFVRVSVSFSKVHERDTHDLLRTSSRGRHEDATRKTGPVEFQLIC